MGRNAAVSQRFHIGFFSIAASLNTAVAEWISLHISMAFIGHSEMIQAFDL